MIRLININIRLCLLLCMVAVLLSGCFKANEPPVFSLSGHTKDSVTQEPLSDVTVTLSGGEDSFSKTTNKNGEYLFEGLSGDVSSWNITATAPSYNSFFETVKIENRSGKNTKEIPMMSIPLLNVSAMSMGFTSSGGTNTFSIISNTSWTVSSSSTSWLTVSPTSGSKNGMVTVSTTANTSTSSRLGTVTVTGGGVTQTVSITQSAASASLAVSVTTMSFASSGGSNTFNITSSTNWTVSSSATSWLTVSHTSGSQNGTITVSAAVNTSSSLRMGLITVTGDGITQSVSVTQSAASALLTVSAMSMSFTSSIGSNTFSITSNTSWTVTKSATWLTVSIVAGSNNGTVTVSTVANTSTVSRMETITVKTADESITRTITVTQSGATISNSDFEILGGVLVKYKGSEKNVIIPSNLKITEIGERAFYNSNIVSVNIPEGVTKIGISAFSDSHSLRSISLPGTLKIIESYAFRMIAATSFTIPVSVTSIGADVFYGSGLNNLEITVGWQTPVSVSSGLFDTYFSPSTLRVPYGTKSRYQSAYFWKNFGSIIEY